MSVDEMPAGRELDALVAEKVMGYGVRKTTYHIGISIQPDGSLLPFNRDQWELLRDGSPIMCYGELMHGYGPAPVPFYSTEIAAAWAVVEHLHEAHHFRCQVEYGGDENPRWGCRIRDDGYRPFQDSEWVESADTAPLAICRAALKAVGA